MPFAVCAYALLVFCGWKATVGILVQWVPCALREGRVCARADAAENTAAGQDLAYCGVGRRVGTECGTNDLQGHV